MANELTDSIQNNEKTKQITEIQLSYGFNQLKMQDSIKHQLEVQVKENQLSTEKNYKYIISSVLLIIVALLFFVYKNYNEKNKANIIITEQKNIVESKQKEILDSISYARKIQSALLANKEFMDENIKDNFVFYKPKDIVSGDFYWATQHHNKFYLAVCDSTGHGVPGAFMSLLNIGFLNEAIKEKNIEQPNEILNHVRHRLIESISNNGQDGMDAILVCFDKINKTITYAAANNQPFIVRGNELLVLPKDKMPVGKGENTKSFTLHTIDLKENDTLYLYTDGYADQFGGEKGKKFKSKQLQDLLVSIANQPMEIQKQKLNDSFKNWKGLLEQVDDVCIVGIKI